MISWGTKVPDEIFYIQKNAVLARWRRTGASTAPGQRRIAPHLEAAGNGESLSEP